MVRKIILCAALVYAALIFTGHVPPARAMECGDTPGPPVIKVRPTTQDIQYDFTLTLAGLSAMKSDSINPYAPTVDTSTGGLREEKPRLKINVKLATKEHPYHKKMCMWYDEIDVEIALAPKIYLADELNYSPCREAVLNHEHKHVNVDRAVMNKYAHQMGAAVKQAVNEIGMFGPFPSADAKTYEQKFFGHIEASLAPVIEELNKEMTAKQQKVDSLEEYEYVNGFCQGHAKGAAANNSKKTKRRR